MRWTLYDAGIYESVAPNRFGKTFNQAVGAWKAYLHGMKVLCNCPVDPSNGKVEHILNFPHTDYDPYQLVFLDLSNCYVITDEAGQVMDARVCAKKDIRQLGYFNYQAKKRDISWHFDTVRDKNIDPRIRLNPDYVLYAHRIPKDWHQPLRMIRIRMDYDGGTAWFTFKRPWEYFPIYNHKTMIRPRPENA